jgi:hypothetical protein
MEVMKMLEGNKICDITGELISNGMLSHKQDAPYYNPLWSNSEKLISMSL